MKTMRHDYELKTVQFLPMNNWKMWAKVECSSITPFAQQENAPPRAR
jgi:hypothetical protein